MVQTSIYRFEINEETGVITLRGELNRELTDSYSLSVTATDGGGRATNENLLISVVDVNDNAPRYQNFMCIFIHLSFDRFILKPPSVFFI